MNILRRLSGPSGSGRKSLWPFICVSFFCILFFGYRAMVESDSASREKTSFGIVGQCEVRGRGNTNYCDYTFSVGDEWYTAVNKAASRLEIGQTVPVYYDSEDPNVSALEEFSEQSRHDLNFVYVLGLALPAVVGFFLWDRAPYKETSESELSENRSSES